MNPVKTYNAINQSNRRSNFAISKMETIYQRRNGKNDDPHRHDYFTVLVVENAKGIHKVDFNTYALGERQVFFVAPGQVHQIIEEKATIGFVMTFNNQFLIQNNIPITFIENLNLFKNYGESPPLLLKNKEFENILRYISQILALFESDKAMKLLSIGAYLKLFLIDCNTICALNPSEINAKNTDNFLISEFKRIVNEEYKSHHATSYYAKRLHITPDHLNRVFKTRTGKTAKAYIQSRIVTEAKRLLFFSKLTNKEIGYELGFNEPTNFSAFFKKCTGYSPSHFLQAQKR